MEKIIGYIGDISLYYLSSASQYESTLNEPNKAYIFPYNNGFIVLYRNCVQGYLREDYLAHRKHNWPDWETYKSHPTTDTVEKLIIKWVKGYPESLRERLPNAVSTPQGQSATYPAKTAIPASLYSSWVFPQEPDSLVRDKWLSNLDQDISLFLHNAASC